MYKLLNDKKIIKYLNKLIDKLIDKWIDKLIDKFRVEKVAIAPKLKKKINQRR